MVDGAASRIGYGSEKTTFAKLMRNSTALCSETNNHTLSA
jgi:hypothetical protein